MAVSLPSVLVVEDNDMLARAVVAWLTELAFDAVSVASAEDGLVELGRGTYDVLLLDLSLGGMSGHAMLKHLRRADDQIPVIVMSGVGDLTDVVQLLRANATDYLAKPFRIEELEAALERAISKKPAAAASRRVAGRSVASQPSRPSAVKSSPAQPARRAAPTAAPPFAVRASIIHLREALARGGLELPAVSHRIAELSAFLYRDDYSIDKVVEVVEADDKLASVILRKANSALYARGRRIGSLRDACVWVGPKIVIGLALEEMLSTVDSSIVEPFRSVLEAMVKNAFTTARLAMSLATMLGRDDEAQIFAIALLHNIGEACCVQLVAGLCGEDQTVSLDELEREVEQVHESFESALARAWRLPTVFVRFAGDHHGKPCSNASDEQLRLILLASWRLALELGHTYFPGQATASAGHELTSLGLERKAINRLLAKLD